MFVSLSLPLIANMDKNTFSTLPLYNTHGHKLPFPVEEKEQFMTALSIQDLQTPRGYLDHFDILLNANKPTRLKSIASPATTGKPKA